MSDDIDTTQAGWSANLKTFDTTGLKTWQLTNGKSGAWSHHQAEHQHHQAEATGNTPPDLTPTFEALSALMREIGLLADDSRRRGPCRGGQCCWDTTVARMESTTHELANMVCALQDRLAGNE